MMRVWLLLLYKIPPEPSAPRVYVWRKLKRLGALLHHETAWVLPATPRTREQFQWLTAEIDEMGGEATLWESQVGLTGSDEQLVREFTTLTESAYTEILAELRSSTADLPALSRRFQQVQVQDYFESDLGPRVRDALLAARGGVDR